MKYFVQSEFNVACPLELGRNVFTELDESADDDDESDAGCSSNSDIEFEFGLGRRGGPSTLFRNSSDIFPGSVAARGCETPRK